MRRLPAAVVRAFVGGKEGADLFLITGPGLRLDAIADAGAFDRALDQAGGFEFLQVLRNCRLSQTEHFDQVAIDTGVCFNQMLNDRDPGRVGQRLHHGSELVLLVGEYLGFGQAHVFIV